MIEIGELGKAITNLKIFLKGINSWGIEDKDFNEIKKRGEAFLKDLQKIYRELELNEEDIGAKKNGAILINLLKKYYKNCGRIKTRLMDKKID